MNEANGSTKWELAFSPARRGATRVGFLQDGVERHSASFNLEGAEARNRFVRTINRHFPAIPVQELEQELQAHATELAEATRAGANRETGREALETTDSGNARRFVRLHGTDLRCVAGIGWHCWDGRRWCRDDHLHVEHLAKSVAGSLLDDAKVHLGSPRADQLTKHALASANRSRIEAAVRLARSEPGIGIQAMSLDADPMLLNVLNGTVDLRTGDLLAHSRDDLITKLAPVTYDAKARSPEFDAFLEQILPDTATRRFVLRVLGYSMTGSIAEQVLIVFWGNGSNGKSTLLELMLSVLGEYGAPIPAELLLASHSDRHLTEVARLHGLRLAVAHESDQSRRLAEGKVKQLTGGDKISARRMREDLFEFEPTHKLVLVTNHKPEVRGTDEGIWRRMLLVPFTYKVPKGQRDKHLPQRLRGELPGILNRLLAGCLEWQRDGLQPPEAVQAAISEYRVEQDLLADWIEERCVTGPQHATPPTPLWNSFSEFHDSRPPLSRKAFYEALTERGLVSDRVHKGRRRKGIALIVGPDSAGVEA